MPKKLLTLAVLALLLLFNGCGTATSKIQEDAPVLPEPAETASIDRGKVEIDKKPDNTIYVSSTHDNACEPYSSITIAFNINGFWEDHLSVVIHADGSGRFKYEGILKQAMGIMLVAAAPGKKPSQPLYLPNQFY